MDKPSRFSRGTALRALVASVAVASAVGLTAYHNPVVASDHDDGETNIKSRNLNLTDLYVFREDWETGAAGAEAGDDKRIVFVMNTNPRSLPRQQYFFNDQALYNFHVSRRVNTGSGEGTVQAVNQPVTGVEDVRFEFSFGKPVDNHQSVRLNVHHFSNGVLQSTDTFADAGTTDTAGAPLASANTADNPHTFNVNLGNNQTAHVFAGLREDPFFFDVEQFFKVRATLLGAPGPHPIPEGIFLPADQAADFAFQYNVNSIVMSLPISVLQANASDHVFDVWETITVPSNFASWNNNQ